MSEYLSPGIYIEETSNAVQTVDAVSTSTMAIVGWTKQGPVDEATVITSPLSFQRTFGGNTHDSLVPLSVSAYFTNGGSRSYVVRVVPSDALKSAAAVPGTVSGESFGAGTGVAHSGVAYTHNLAFQPTPGSVTITWKEYTVVSGETLNINTGAIGVDSVFNVNTAHALITNDIVTVHWTHTGAKLFTIDSAGVLGGANAGLISSATLDRVTGILVIDFGTNKPDGASTITADYNWVSSTQTVTDTPAGLTGSFTGAGISAASVTYATGACTITWTGGTVVPYNGNAITVTYTGNQWDFVAANEGAWGNDLKVRIKGNDNFFSYNLPTVSGAGAWTKYDVLVMLKNSDTGVYEVKETYEELSFTDATDVMFAPSVINDSSSLVTLTDNGYRDVPSTFKGVNHLLEVVGAGTGALKIFTHTASNIPLVKGSFKLHYTIAASPLTAVADADGVISGTDIDSTKTNTVDWTTGVVTLNFSTAPDNATNVTMDYITYPTTSYVDYTLTAGSDGTMSSITETRVSNAAALQASRKGMYAMDRIDDVFQLVIPDFAGNVLVQSDMLDYCDLRRDCFSIITTPSGRSAQQAVDWLRITFNKKSKYAAVYWPWVTVADPLANGRSLLVPPVAHVAGVYARTDATKNVGKAPAGMVDGALRGIIGLEFKPGKGDRDIVYPARINPLIDSTQTGRAVWGCRTLSPTNDAFKWVNAVRLFVFVEKSVFNSTHNLVFENIGAGLYTSIKSQLDGFLLNLFNQGYFAGATPTQAYKVICDSSNNPPEVANAGQVVVSVAIAPNRPGEFIRFVFSQSVLS